MHRVRVVPGGFVHDRCPLVDFVTQGRSNVIGSLQAVGARPGYVLCLRAVQASYKGIGPARIVSFRVSMEDSREREAHLYKATLVANRSQLSENRRAVDVHEWNGITRVCDPICDHLLA